MSGAQTREEWTNNLVFALWMQQELEYIWRGVPLCLPSGPLDVGAGDLDETKKETEEQLEFLLTKCQIK